MKSYKNHADDKLLSKVLVDYLSNVDIQRESSHKPLCYFSSITSLWAAVPFVALLPNSMFIQEVQHQGSVNSLSLDMDDIQNHDSDKQFLVLSDIEIKISYFDKMKELQRVNRLIPCMTVKFSEHFKLHGSSSFINVQASLKELDKWLVKKHCIKLN